MWQQQNEPSKPGIIGAQDDLVRDEVRLFLS
jgi:hypothetical protein